VVLTQTGNLIGWAGIARPGDGTEEMRAAAAHDADPQSHFYEAAFSQLKQVTT